MTRLVKTSQGHDRAKKAIGVCWCWTDFDIFKKPTINVLFKGPAKNITFFHTILSFYLTLVKHGNAIDVNDTMTFFSFMRPRLIEFSCSWLKVKFFKVNPMDLSER